MNKVAVVTGSNKGIGFAIVRALCKQINTVYLTGIFLKNSQFFI
jgi:NAD(P)-dependent dehydrogenase (short-subunit alcohol dehydrogenase family)